MRRPLCVTDPEWELWRAFEEAVPWPSQRSNSPCRDCPATFAAEMRAVHRCDGSPGMTGALKEPTEQRRQWREASRRKLQKQRTIGAGA